MRRSISAGPTCWGSGAGADRIRFPARRLERAAPGRLVHRARIEAGIKSQPTTFSPGLAIAVAQPSLPPSPVKSGDVGLSPPQPDGCKERSRIYLADG